ncbi:MAG TPA: pyridoxamine 5'-phosphate oxidase [Acidimicrobiales bacterium]
MDAPEFDLDPLRQLASWLEAARAAAAPMPEAMALSSASADGQPSVRMVILRGLRDGLTFFTDAESDKGTELVANPRAAAVFHWLLPINRQVRVAGSVSVVSDEEADRYWASRPPGVRYNAIASHQSRVVESRESLADALQAAARRYPDESSIPRPARWGGFRIAPEVVEFWEEKPDRIHDRIRYRRSSASWEIERLSP